MYYEHVAAYATTQVIYKRAPRFPESSLKAGLRMGYRTCNDPSHIQACPLHCVQATAILLPSSSFGHFIREHLLDAMERWDLCAFNSACHTKYEKLRGPWPYAGQPLLDQRTVAALRNADLATGIPAETLVVSGLIAKDGPP